MTAAQEFNKQKAREKRFAKANKDINAYITDNEIAASATLLNTGLMDMNGVFSVNDLAAFAGILLEHEVWK